jgi:hypothetical protein
MKLTCNCFLFCNHGETQSEVSVTDLGKNFSYNLITAQTGVLFTTQRHKCVTKLNSGCSISWKAGIREMSCILPALKHTGVSTCNGNCYERIPWNRVLLVRLTVAHLLKK